MILLTLAIAAVALLLVCAVCLAFCWRELFTLRTGELPARDLLARWSRRTRRYL